MTGEGRPEEVVAAASRPGLSPDEQGRLRLARLTIYVAPVLGGLLTVVFGAAANSVGISNRSGEATFVAFLANTAIASVVSAYAVVRWHPVQRGKWWRMGAAALFAVPISFVAVTVFGAIAAASGHHM